MLVQARTYYFPSNSAILFLHYLQFLFDLENPLKVGDQVHFTLHFKDQQGKELTVTADSEIKEE